MLEEFGKPLAVGELDLSEPRPGEVLVRLIACGVCHTDMYTASGVDPSGYAPTVLGHEGAGVVERVGEDVREELARFGGREVKTVGDGFVATFDGPPSHALRCALAITEAARALGIEVRVGMHTGECELIGEDVGGMAVHIAARVSALAGPGEVLVSGTVFGTVVGGPFSFTDRGFHELRGVPGRWPLFALGR